MKQRDYDGDTIKHHVSPEIFLGNLIRDQKRNEASDKAAVEYHSAQVTAEQKLHEFNKAVFAYVPEQIDDLGRIGKTIDYVGSYYGSGCEKQARHGCIFQVDFLFP